MLEDIALRELQIFADAGDIWVSRKGTPQRISVCLDRRADEVCKLLRQVSSLKIMFQLGSSDHSLTDTGLFELTGHPGIEELQLYSKGITSKGFEVLPTLPRLRDVGIVINQCVDFACASIGRCEGLEKLSFSGGEITDAGLREFGSLSKLTELDLSCNPVCKEARVCVRMPNLTTLNCYRANVVDEGLLPLVGHPELRNINLAESKITDESGVILSTIPHLRSLDLSDTVITDRTGVSLGSAENLESLYIGGTKITVETIDALKQASRLECLFLNKIVIDAEMLKALNELPSLEKLFIGGRKYLRVPRNRCETLNRKLEQGITFVDDD